MAKTEENIWAAYDKMTEKQRTAANNILRLCGKRATQAATESIIDLLGL
jgi:hypothetical protein